MRDIQYGRKRSGIKKELNKKISAWLESIDDEDLRALARRDVIVTGGSIASMLLGEPVNDYDVYFKTLDTTRLIAEYYVNKFVAEKKKTDDIDYIPEVRVEDVGNCRGVMEQRVMIYMQSAGVAGVSQTPYQYFEQVPDELAEQFAESLDTVADGIPYRATFLSANAITLSDKMQIVIRFYGSPEEIHGNYDFAHAMCYWDHADQYLHLPGEALEAMLGRTLIYRGSLYPIASLFRTKKFLERGWRISAGQQLKIAWQISELDLTNFAVIREQLTGVDQAHLHQLIEALRDVDPDKINSAYVATIIDKVFGT